MTSMLQDADHLMLFLTSMLGWSPFPPFQAKNAHLAACSSQSLRKVWSHRCFHFFLVASQMDDKNNELIPSWLMRGRQTMISILSLLFVYGNNCLCFLLDCFLFGTKGRCPPAVHTHPLEMPWKVANVSAYHLDTFRLVQSIPTLSTVPVCPSPVKLFQAHAILSLSIKKKDDGSTHTAASETGWCCSFMYFRCFFSWVKWPGR